jgi:hypothetical protein
LPQGIVARIVASDQACVAHRSQNGVAASLCHRSPYKVGIFKGLVAALRGPETRLPSIIGAVGQFGSGESLVEFVVRRRKPIKMRAADGGEEERVRLTGDDAMETWVDGHWVRLELWKALNGNKF